MIGLSWNCRGLGNQRAVIALCDLVRSHRPTFIFLVETLVHRDKIEAIKRRLGYAGCFCVDRLGRGGGLAFLWNAEATCSIMSFSHHYIDVSIQVAGTDLWRCTGLYGFPERSRRKDTWELMRVLKAKSDLPWCVIGDFNNLLSQEEKLGGVAYSQCLIEGFREAVSDCGLVDLVMAGYAFTWERGRGKDSWVAEKLDRCMVTDKWLSIYPEARLNNLVAPVSDHSPILLSTRQINRHYTPRRFRFENLWLGEPDFCAMVESHWELSSHLNLSNRLNECVSSMAQWGRDFHMQFKNKLRSCKKTLISSRVLHNPTDVETYNQNRVELAKVLWQEEVFWKQRAKSFWLQGGDSNSKFFHATASSRKRNNRILKLQNDADEWVEDTKELQSLVVNYFQKLFDEGHANVVPDLSSINSRIDVEQNNLLVAPFTYDEFKRAIFQMHPDKSPGPDGLSPAFFQRFWHRIGSHIFEACSSWLSTNEFPDGLNDTIIVLIPKCEAPTTMKDLRPISLCNVLYKLIAKVLANRLKLVLPNLISEQQSAFVPGRSITDNVLMAFELIHKMKRKKAKVGDVAIKIDISKAYDRLRWNYLETIMQRMGFHSQWISWIMLCVSTVNYSVKINGEVVGSISPRRGLRQGDPLSPYLFILCAEGLSALLLQAEQEGLIHGIRASRKGPSVSHLLFADDSFFFFQATIQESKAMAAIFKRYEQDSGQAINYSKSGIFYSASVCPSMRHDISRTLQISAHLDTGRYLGLPSLIGRKKHDVFSFLRDRMWRRLQGWKGKLLSQAGREILIKSVAQAIPTYCMSVFQLPRSLVDRLQKMMNSFYWGMKEDGRRRIHWYSWERLCCRKEEGGLGFKDLHTFNLAMLGKQGWTLLQRPNALVSRLFKAKYYPEGNFLSASRGSNPSFTWQSIWSSTPVLRHGYRWRIGDGSTINVWRDSWLRGGLECKVTTPLIEDLEDLRVCDLWFPARKEWDVELVNGLFNYVDAQNILSLPLCSRYASDVLIWHLNGKGTYTVRSGYRAIIDGPTVNATTSNEGGWRKLWAMHIPPRVRVFLWRVCCDSLATKHRLLLKGIAVDNICTLCGEYGEHALHLFLDCEFASQCWQHAGIALCSHNANNMYEWFMAQLERNDTNYNSRIGMIMWNIWQQRNAKLWGKHVMSAAQVVEGGLSFLREWQQAQKRVHGPTQTVAAEGCTTWAKPPCGFLKCNIDASLFSTEQCVGVGGVLRDHNGTFVAAISRIRNGLFSAKEAEALALWEVLLVERGESNIILEMDNKGVVEAINGLSHDSSEFGMILNECRDLLTFVSFSTIRFARRQCNVVAHEIARAANSHGSDMLWLNAPTFLENVLAGDVFNLN